MKLTPHKKKPLIWYISKHRKLWDWLAENPEMEKHNWPGWKRFTRYYEGRCFLCQYVMDYYGTKGRNDCAVFCPVIWRNTFQLSHCGDYKSLYNKWDDAGCMKDFTERKYLACKIRDLPLKPEAEKALKLNSK
jgi:hypothetical protein